MGQLISVTRTSTPRSGVLRIEVNRDLTGMAHERYLAGSTVVGDRPPDVLARRLLDHGGVAAVHVHHNIITVELETGADGSGLADLVRDLYLHYREGVTPSFAG